jgi:hypothetical protein
LIVSGFDTNRAVDAAYLDMRSGLKLIGLMNFFAFFEVRVLISGGANFSGAMFQARIFVF